MTRERGVRLGDRTLVIWGQIQTDFLFAQLPEKTKLLQSYHIFSQAIPDQTLYLSPAWAEFEPEPSGTHPQEP